MGLWGPLGEGLWQGEPQGWPGDAGGVGPKAAGRGLFSVGEVQLSREMQTELEGEKSMSSFSAVTSTPYEGAVMETFKYQ
jgi:hypothetical protein